MLGAKDSSENIYASFHISDARDGLEGTTGIVYTMDLHGGHIIMMMMII